MKHSVSTSSRSYSPDEILKIGEDFYFSQLKDKLEKTNNGDYVVLEVESKKYFVDSDLLQALNKAKEKFPNKLFHIVQIGTLQRAAVNFRRNNKYAWIF